MIELDYPRERMLADILAGAAGARPCEPSDVTAYAHLAQGDEAHLRFVLQRPQEILPQLNAALAARFACVPSERLERSLLLPLKKALGNAHKRGNLCAPGKRITLELVVTRAGAFVEVADEGAGFDVAATYARFRDGARYFSHGGSGFRKFEKADAIVSFAEHGSTVRICFRSAGPSARERAGGAA